ncbi:MAG: hypothetical protein NTX76_02855 [Alphaproteobacteria bacterium]|nr:hypothetical protein [Alphaproteobacteria bacterium]
MFRCCFLIFLSGFVYAAGIEDAPHFSREVAKHFRVNLYQNYFVGSPDAWEDFCSQPSGVMPEAGRRNPEVIVTMTSYPARMPTICLAIESLMRQSVKPDRIVLNLFRGDFPDQKIPLSIEMQQKRGLEINWCDENLKVYLKVIPATKKYPNAILIAADDDTIYPENRLEGLLNGHAEHPNAIVCTDGIRLTSASGKLLMDASQWHFTGSQQDLSPQADPSFTFMAQGVHGMLIPPNSFYPDFDHPEKFTDLCPTDDDSWLWAMAVANGTKTYKVARIGICHESILGTQDIPTALHKANFADNRASLTQYFSALRPYYQDRLFPLIRL